MSWICDNRFIKINLENIMFLILASTRIVLFKTKIKPIPNYENKWKIPENKRMLVDIENTVTISAIML